MDKRLSISFNWQGNRDREAADLPMCARLHANQARAIAKGDADAAARGSDKLMDYVETFTRATVSV